VIKKVLRKATRMISEGLHRPVARGGGCWGPGSIKNGLRPITRPWAPSALLAPSLIRIPDLGIFKIDIYAAVNPSMLR